MRRPGGCPTDPHRTCQLPPSASGYTPLALGVDVPVWLAHVIARATSADPGDRYSTPTALADALSSQDARVAAGLASITRDQCVLCGALDVLGTAVCPSCTSGSTRADALVFLSMPTSPDERDRALDAAAIAAGRRRQGGNARGGVDRRQAAHARAGRVGGSRGRDPGGSRAARACRARTRAVAGAARGIPGHDGRRGRRRHHRRHVRQPAARGDGGSVRAAAGWWRDHGASPARDHVDRQASALSNAHARAHCRDVRGARVRARRGRCSPTSCVVVRRCDGRSRCVRTRPGRA